MNNGDRYERPISEDMRQLGNDFARVGGRAVKTGFNAVKNSPINSVEGSGIMFAKICRITAYIIYAIGVIAFFNILMFKPMQESLYGIGDSINEAFSGMIFFSAIMSLIASFAAGSLFMAFSYIIELLNVSNMKKNQIIDLLQDNNEITFLQSEILEKK